MQAVTRTMIRRGLQSGTVTGKIDIIIKEVTSSDGEVYKMMVLEPDVKMKIGSKDTIKCNKVGAMFAQIKEDGKVIAGDRQISMDELMEQEGA